MDKLLTGTDVLKWHANGAELLVIAPDGYAYLADTPDRPEPYQLITDTDGAELHVLIRRDGIEGWFPDAIDANGTLREDVAEEMAEIVNTDAQIPLMIAVDVVRNAETSAVHALRLARRAAHERAVAVAEVVRLAGSQQAAAHILGMDPTRVSRLVTKSRRPEPTA